MNVHLCFAKVTWVLQVKFMEEVFFALEKKEENANNIIFMRFSGYLFPTQDVIPTLKPLFSLHLLHSCFLTHRAWLCAAVTEHYVQLF